MPLLLGCIADDLTGASDLASFLVAAGMRTALFVGIPEQQSVPEEMDAIVVALKSRALPPADAVALSLKALDWLISHPCEQYYFKYCSTFDSTPQGNIGPVLDALMARLDSNFTIACPSLPINGRTQYAGYLFVNGLLLNESGMEQHPLTPMRDANLVRVLQAQASGLVGLIDFTTVTQGGDAVRQRLNQLAESDTRYALVDALEQRDLITISQACRGQKLLSGGSGLAAGLASCYAAEGRLVGSEKSRSLESVAGDTLVLAGSCSKATLEQIAVFCKTHRSFKLDPLALHEKRQSIAQIIDWFTAHRQSGPLLIYASDRPEVIKTQQAIFGTADASQLIEEAICAITRELLRLNVRKFIVAGGETSGAVIRALNPSGFRIGPSIAPGVPLMQTLDQPATLVALKSGNFGDRNFLLTALERMT